MTESPLRSLVNRRNRLRRVLKVQEVHNKEWEEGLTKKYVWKKYIQNEFNIEYYTYISYLGINARRELKIIQEAIDNLNTAKLESMKNPAQTTLFTLAAFALLLASCGIRPSDLAQTCAEQYPCKDSLVVTETTRTDTLELTDTYVVYLDTTKCPPSTDGVTLIDFDTVLVPGKKIIITKTVNDSTWYRLDRAALAAMQQDLDKADKAIAQLISEKAVAEAKAYTLHKRCIWLYVALAAMAALFLVIVWRRIKPA